MKWKCEICSTEQPCILEIDDNDQTVPPDECPFGKRYNISEWEVVTNEQIPE